MAFKAILKVGGEERTLLTYHNYYFDMWIGDLSKVKELSSTFPTLYDYKAVAQASPYAFKRYSEPYGGLFDVTMESTDDDDTFYHLFKTTKEGYTRMANGVIELYDSKDEYMPMRRIEFWDAWIGEIWEHQCSTDSKPMILGFTLSPATIRVNKELVFQKNWFITDINQQEGQAKQETELFVSEIKWRGKKDNYVSSVYRKDIMLNHGIDLEVATKDFYEGEQFELTVKQSNGRRIKGQSTEFSVSGSVDADGLATIPSFKVECDFKDDNQSFGDIIFYHKDREVARFKENFGWTYIKEGGITKIYVNIEFNAGIIPMGYTETDLKEAINSSFRRTLENSSGKSVTGRLFFNGLYSIELPQYVPKMQVVKGISGNGMIYMGVVTAEVDTDGKEVLTEMSETAVHELLHSVRLDHPFERIQTNDTFLFNDGFNRLGTSLATDPNIYYNIMIYNFCIINGHRLDDLWKTKRPEYLTKEQLQLIFREIDLQATGAGTHQEMNVSDLVHNQEEIEIINDNGIIPSQWSAFDWYWNITIPGKRIKGYQHRETRTKPN